MFNFTIWDVIAGILLSPFFIVKTLLQNINPTKRKRDNAIIDPYYEFMQDEATKFVNYMGKGPVELHKYRIRNVLPTEIHIEFYYGSNEWNEQHRIALIVKRAEKTISFGTGGHSGIGFQSFKKDNFDLEKIARNVYRDIEHSWPRGCDTRDFWKKHDEWKNMIFKPLMQKYEFDERNYYPIRRALIMSMYEPSHLKYIKAKEELLDIFKDEQKVKDFVEDIDGIYSSKTVFEVLV